MSTVVDGAPGEVRSCCFMSNQEMNASRILPGIIRAVDVFRVVFVHFAYVDFVDFDFSL